MIHLKNLSKYYPTKSGRSYVFKDVNLSIPMDKSVAVIGPNGAGKSTLIRMIGGADLPSKGVIESNLSLSWPLGLQGGLHGSMTGRENTRFVARIHGIKDTKLVEQKVEEFAEIGRYFDESAKSYSNGMKARVAFGITMAFDFDFDVLLIDELTAVGDMAFKQKSEKILKEKYTNTKIMMVNHNFQQLKVFCESAIFLTNNQVIYFESIDDAIDKYKSTYATIS
ncbi:ABC transporter ATP-binding protein [Oceaniserpentilla sp. 4NH20-0058]|uniref:ABC transporter ATP-binding protein n=1 Tax=Oceaniserpentilla sp. 4NH20-0058 TaxID=3127660 RepID=UPI00310AC0BD